MIDTKIYINTFWDYEYDAQGFSKSNTKYEMLDVGVGDCTLRNYSIPAGRLDHHRYLFEFDQNMGQYYMPIDGD